MKTKRFLLLLVALISFGNFMNAQIKFRKVIGNTGYDYGVSAQQTIDSGYVVLGSTSSFGAGSTDIYMVKTDSLGVPYWHQTFGGINIDRGTCVKQTADTGYVILGYTNSFGAGGYDVYLIKLDKFYNTSWTKTYGGTNWDFGNCVEQTTDGGYIICGETYSYGNGDEDYYIIKTDALGDTTWTKTYGGINQDIAKSIIETSDGNYLVTGTSKSNGDIDGDFYTLKLNSINGDSLWSNKYGGPAADFGNDVVESMFGGYLLTGESKNFGLGNSYGILVKISPLGITDSVLTLGGTQDDEFVSLTEDANGKISMIGTTKSYGDGGGNGDMFFYTLKSDWTYYGLTTFGTLQRDNGFSVEPTNDNAFIICGTSNGFNMGIDDIYLIKTDTLCLATVATSNFYTSIYDYSSAPTVQLNIYPNPASDKINIDLHLFEGETTIELFDAFGKKVVSEELEVKGNETIFLESESLTQGIYLIRVSDRQSVKTQKLVIQHY